MKRNNPIERSKAVMMKVETDGSDADVGLWEVAAMVYVGDIYALIALGAEEENAVAPAGTPVDSVWPFIR